jgi:U3 small nucleolar RNA-associated protein 10
VPTFIGAKQLGTVLRAAIDNRERNEESSSALISVCARKIPTKVLFPVVMELWKSVQSADEKVTLMPGQSLMIQVLEGFFHLLRLTLRNADRAVLPTLIKTIFAFFLDVFDLRHKLQSRALDLEVS